MSPEGIKNRDLANLRPDVRKKRSETAKKNTYKRMMNKDKYSKLNKFLEEKMNESGLYPIREYPIGPYSVDFCFPEEKLIIEADGDFWHANPELLKERNKTTLYPLQKKTIALDKAKNSYLKNHGWILFRFWERDIYKNLENCLIEIKNYLNRDKQLCQ
jgi:very-short-patch-repair endonuclease